MLKLIINTLLKNVHKILESNQSPSLRANSKMYELHKDLLYTIQFK